MIMLLGSIDKMWYKYVTMKVYIIIGHIVFAGLLWLFDQWDYKKVFDCILCDIKKSLIFISEAYYNTSHANVTSRNQICQ